VDGGLGLNNAVEQVWNEAQNIWCNDQEIEFRGLLKCFVLIETGNPRRKPIAEASLKFFSEALVELRRRQRILQRCLCKDTDSYMKANGIFGSTSRKAFRM
jgi:hypothetical protein